MMKRWIAGAALLAGVAGAPVLAQDDGAPGARGDDAAMEQVFSTMQAMFPVKPLTAAEETRLPQAQRIVETMIPPGTLDEMMGGMFDKLLGPLLNVAETPNAASVGLRLGVDDGELDLTAQESAEIMGILDPAYQQRTSIMSVEMPKMMRRMMALMEPGMRKAMSEAYAINFDATELSDIEAFFNTPSGVSFARKSFTMASDPRIMASSMEALPLVMGEMKTMGEQIEAAQAALPPEKTYDDLTAAQRARIIALTGQTEETLRDRMGQADMESEAITDVYIEEGDVSEDAAVEDTMNDDTQ